MGNVTMSADTANPENLNHNYLEACRLIQALTDVIEGHEYDLIVNKNLRRDMVDFRDKCVEIGMWVFCGQRYDGSLDDIHE